MDAVKLHKQSILVTELLNLGSDPEDIMTALDIHRRDAIGWLHSNKKQSDVIAITDIIKNLSLVINEISEATGKDPAQLQQ